MMSHYGTTSHHQMKQVRYFSSSPGFVSDTVYNGVFTDRRKSRYKVILCDGINDGN